MPRLPATLVGLGPDGAPIYRPIIRLNIEIGNRGLEYPGLVDSGADGTLVPAQAIAPLGIDFFTLPAGPGGNGPGGGLDTRPCQGIIRWGKVVLLTEFFVAEPTKGPECVLLGRSDFFRLFIPRFHWHKEPPVFDLDPVARP